MAHSHSLIGGAVVATSLALISLNLPKALEDGHLPSNFFTEINAGLYAPTVSVKSTRVSTGWDLEINTENWIFTDLCGDPSSEITSGHAHIYVNEEKVGTAKTPYFHIADRPGTLPLEVKVSLRSSDHRVLVSDGGVIMSTITLKNID